MTTERYHSSISLISKPLAPPWYDGSRLLPRYLIEYSTQTTYKIMTSTRQPFTWENTSSHQVYTSPAHQSPSLRDTLRITTHVARQFYQSKSTPHPIPLHFFFTPNPKTSTLFKFLHQINPGLQTIQTITSLPNLQKASPALFFTKMLVAVSNHSLNKLSQYLNRPVQLIYPGIPEPKLPQKHSQVDSSEEYIIYPGDLAYAGCQSNLEAMAHWLQSHYPSIRLIITNRWKTPEDRNVAKTLSDRFGDLFQFTGTTKHMLSLLAGATAVIFPVTSLYAKMDIPLVLLEAMALGKPMILSNTGALPELAGDPTSNHTPAAILCRATEPGEFIDALNHLLSNPAAANDLGQAAHLRFTSRFTAASMATKYENLYHELNTCEKK